jgi:hypothetical protein
MSPRRSTVAMIAPEDGSGAYTNSCGMRLLTTCIDLSGFVPLLRIQRTPYPTVPTAQLSVNTVEQHSRTLAKRKASCHISWMITILADAIKASNGLTTSLNTWNTGTKLFQAHGLMNPRMHVAKERQHHQKVLGLPALTLRKLHTRCGRLMPVRWDCQFLKPKMMCHLHYDHQSISLILPLPQNLMHIRSITLTSPVMAISQL